MNVFDLYAKLALDSSEYEKGLNDAESKGSKFGGGLATAAKVGMAAVGTATTAIVGFGAASVKTGMGFDSSMSQVAATMGKTTEEIGELRDFAQEMGRTTAFSATEAADALNYMALAGYDANTSMEMLPNVLNLASAGAMDLATASDMVTDAQSALGLEMGDMEGFVDQLAQTASKSNTSVQQLGEAILTVGGTAKVLSGGTTELNTALGILADNGIKGSEGGTKLRNVILSLSAPTDKAAAELEALGVSTVDAEGNMRPLEDIMGELGDSLDGLGTADRAAVINTIFNKQDIGAVNALLDTSADRWNELSAAIDDSAGSAQKMADTQLDNLQGSVTLFKSALEGAQIAISDALSPALKEFVDFGTDGLSKLTGAFEEGGLEGAMEAFGQILADGLNMIIEMLPQAVDAGLALLEAVLQGILDNLDLIIDSALQIADQLLQGLLSALPQILQGGMQIILGLAMGISEALPELIPQIVEVILQIVQMFVDNIDLMVEAAIALMMGLAQGLISAVPVLIEKAPEIISQLAQAIATNAPLLFNAIITMLVQIGTLLIQYGTQFIENVKTTMSNIIETVKTWLSQLPERMAYFAGQAVAQFVNKLMMLPSKIVQIFSNVLSNVRSFGSNMRENAGNIAREFGDRLINGLKDLVSKIADIGRDIVEGLKNGIKNAWTGLTDWVRDLAKNLIQGFKDNLKIGSPSKVFRDEIGRWIPAGIAVGITDNEGVIFDAIDALTSDIISVDNPLSASIDNLSRAFGTVSENQSINVYVTLEGDANRLFRVIQSEANRNYQITGQNMVVMA